MISSPDLVLAVILTIGTARSLKLWNEVPSNKFQTSLPQKLVTKDESC